MALNPTQIANNQRPNVVNFYQDFVAKRTQRLLPRTDREGLIYWPKISGKQELYLIFFQSII